MSDDERKSSETNAIIAIPQMSIRRLIDGKYLPSYADGVITDIPVLTGYAQIGDTVEVYWDGQRTTWYKLTSLVTFGLTTSGAFFVPYARQWINSQLKLTRGGITIGEAPVRTIYMGQIL